MLFEANMKIEWVVQIRGLVLDFGFLSFIGKIDRTCLSVGLFLFNLLNCIQVCYVPMHVWGFVFRRFGFSSPSFFGTTNMAVLEFLLHSLVDANQ